MFNGPKGKAVDIYFFKPPDFCLGQHETRKWTAANWAEDQGAVTYHKMTAKWSELKAMFQSDPWGVEGASGPKGKMALMATYNMDSFSDFVFKSTFLKRYKVKRGILKTISADEAALLRFGFEWVKFILWGVKSQYLGLRG